MGSATGDLAWIRCPSGKTSNAQATQRYPYWNGNGLFNVRQEGVRQMIEEVKQEYPPTGSSFDYAISEYAFGLEKPGRFYHLQALMQKFQFTMLCSAHDEWNPHHPNPYTYFVHAVQKISDLP